MAPGINHRYILAIILLLRRRRRRRRPRAEKQKVRQFWIRPIFAKREQLGEFHTLVKEMREKVKNIEPKINGCRKKRSKYVW